MSGSLQNERPFDKFHARCGHQGRTTVPDDTRDHAHEGVHRGTRKHGQASGFNGAIPPTPQLVDQFFNDSTGTGEDGEIDARGVWNQGGNWQFVDAPAFQDARTGLSDRVAAAPTVDDRTMNTGSDPAMLEELLVEDLRDLLHAEGQLVKALPKMAKAAKSPVLRQAFEVHLEETRGHVERLKEVFGLLGVEAKAKPCQGMAGLVEEGQEVMQEGEEKDVRAADLALIAVAQKVDTTRCPVTAPPGRPRVRFLDLT